MQPADMPWKGNVSAMLSKNYMYMADFIGPATLEKKNGWFELPKMTFEHCCPLTKWSHSTADPNTVLQALGFFGGSSEISMTSAKSFNDLTQMGYKI